MTAAAAFPAAAQRLVRSVAGRRALRVSLFVGALLALGLLFGGRAQAAESVDAPQSTDTVSSSADSGTSAGDGSTSGVGSATSGFESAGSAMRSDSASSTDPAPESDPKPESDPERNLQPEPKAADEAAHKATAADEATRKSKATDQAALKSALRPTARAAAVTTSAAAATTAAATSATRYASTTSTATTTTVSLVRYVTGELTRTVANPLGVLAEEAARRLPESPFPRPSLPEFGDVGPGDDATQPVPDRVAPQQRGHGARADGEARKQGPASVCQLRDHGAGVFLGAGHHAHEFAGRDVRRQQPQLPFDAPQGPYGIAGQSASDGGSQRHGELNATTVAGVPSFQLVAGEGSATAYHPTRDRHRDILEFPG